MRMGRGIVEHIRNSITAGLRKCYEREREDIKIDRRKQRDINRKEINPYKLAHIVTRR